MTEALTAPWTAHILYALAWASFGAGHSALATSAARAWMRARFGRAYRLVYNAVALVHILAVGAAGWLLLDPLPDFTLPLWAAAAMTAVSLAGGVLFLWSLTFYDTGLLLGTRQWREGLQADEAEPLTLRGPHRLVRHPLYAAGFLILWGRVVDPLGLATAVWASAYLVIGARFEERKLLRHYGPAYAAYRRRVPMFLPWKGWTRESDPTGPPTPGIGA